MERMEKNMEITVMQYTISFLHHPRIVIEPCLFHAFST